MNGVPRNQDKIEPGDIVRVEFEHVTIIPRAKIISYPSATGDSWIMRACEPHPLNGELYYVQSFARMTLLEKAT